MTEKTENLKIAHTWAGVALQQLSLSGVPFDSYTSDESIVISFRNKRKYSDIEFMFDGTVLCIVLNKEYTHAWEIPEINAQSISDALHTILEFIN